LGFIYQNTITVHGPINIKLHWSFMYRKPVSVKLDLAVLKSRGINWTRRCHVLETCGYERVKIAVLGPVALEGVLMIVKQCSSLLSPSKDRGSKEEGKQMLKWRRKSENVVK